MNLHYGVVENAFDPEKLGRVQVRIVGKHTENRIDPTQRDYLPVTDLPWAQTLQVGTTISNESSGFAVPKNGTVVVLSFIDEEEQMPIILGSVPKIPETLPDFTQGFTDPNGENPSIESLGTSPISNYATGNPVPTGVTEKINNVESNVICVDEVWSEPPTPFSPIYPFNQVMQSGLNVFELDSTPGAERINLQHVTGSFKEVHPDGSEVVKIKGEEYLIVEGDRNILIKGGSNITVRGLTSGFNVEATRDVHMKSVAGNVKLEAEVGAVELTSPTSIIVDTDGVLTISALSGSIIIDGILLVSASVISLN